MTSKVILTNVQVLAAGTKIEQDAEGNKPMAVSVVTLLVNPEESERLTLASDRRQDSARAAQPARQGHPRDARRRSRGAAREPAAHPVGEHRARTGKTATPARAPAPPSRRPSRSSVATSARTKSCVGRSRSMTSQANGHSCVDAGTLSRRRHLRTTVVCAQDRARHCRHHRRRAASAASPNRAPSDRPPARRPLDDRRRRQRRSRACR